jgi:phosphopantothenoylcysteine decarboxylase
VGLHVTTGDPSPGVLYVLVCGSPLARDVGVLVGLAQSEGWEVCVITTPDGRKFVDVAALQTQTGHPVRTYYKNPGDHDLLPPADAMIVAPATVNTVNKWAVGLADTLALGLLVEGQGKRLPIVAMPYTNAAMAAHPSFGESIARLRGWGVTVLFGEGVVSLPSPGTGEQYVNEFPWGLALEALYARLPVERQPYG